MTSEWVGRVKEALGLAIPHEEPTEPSEPVSSPNPRIKDLYMVLHLIGKMEPTYMEAVLGKNITYSIATQCLQFCLDSKLVEVVRDIPPTLFRVSERGRTIVKVFEGVEL